MLLAGGSINFSELRDVKIRLSRSDQELKKLKDEYAQLTDKMALKESIFSELQRERDNLRLKNEILCENLTKSGIQLDSSQDSSSGDKLTLVEEYKQKINSLQKDLEKKTNELMNKSLQVGELQAKKQIDDQLLNKQIEDIKRLKGMLKKYEEAGTTPQASSSAKKPLEAGSRFKLNLQGVTGQAPSEVKKYQVQFDAEGINKKLIDNFSIQLDSMFGGIIQDEDGQAVQTKSPKKNKIYGLMEDSGLPQSSDDELLTNGLQDLDESLNANNNILEREKILTTFKSSVQQMQTELVEMMKNNYESQIQEIQANIKHIDNEKQATLKKTTDTKQMQVIEAQYKQKMDDLQKQLVTFKDKEKQQEQKAKQINMQENKIKTLEDDIFKFKKTKETLEKQMKSETEKFSKFKQNVSKELITAKKAMTEKELEMQKLKHNLKKTDQLAQQKISELRGFQKKVYEDRLKRDIEKQQDHDKKGIDIDRIKTWITQNTDRMLMHNELKDAIDKHQSEKDRIEEDIIEFGDKLSALMLDKDRKEIEKQQLELSEGQVDEGRIYELEEEIYQVSYEIQNINDELETLDDTYNRHSSQLNQLQEEVIALDVDNIEPLKFSGLQSVDAARVTLQTFFSVMLDLNIYKRDLENKCIESDEAILELNHQVSQLQKQMEELNEKANNSSGNIMNSNQSAATDITNSKNQALKEKAIKNIVNNLEGYVDYENVKNLNLTPNEQNSLTKLSLSKIVSNLKQQLEEEKKKNQTLVFKLEQAIKDKESYRLKFDNLKKKNVDDAIVKDPLLLSNGGGNHGSQPEPSKPFSSLAAARANRRGQTTNKIGGSDTQSESSASNAGGKFRSRLNQQKSDEGSEMKAPRFGAVQSQSGRFQQQKKPSFMMMKNQQREASDSQTRRDPNGEQVLSKPKLPNFMNKTKSSAAQQLQPREGQMQRRQPAFRKPQISASQIEEVEVLNQQTTPVVEIQMQQQPQVKVVPSLRDRRNQRKLENNDDALQKNESEKVNFDEIDKIKEETFQITNNQSHYDRRQSRARAFSKKIQNERGYSGSQTRPDNQSEEEEEIQTIQQKYGGPVHEGFEEVEGEDSPRVSQNTSGAGGKLQDDSYGQQEVSAIMQQEDGANQTFNQQSQEFVNPWTHEELAFIENQGSKLIGCNCFEKKIVLFFEDFTVREISLDNLLENPAFNLLQINGIVLENPEQVVDIAIDKDLQAIAVASQANVYIFDFQFQYQSKIELYNIEKVVFCEYNIVIQVNVDDAVCFIAYQIDDGSELGLFEMKTEGKKPILKSDETFIYVACGIKLIKLSMPQLEAVFTMETEHLNDIIDFTISPSAITTTSVDRSVRVHDLNTGEQCTNSIDDLDCDHVESIDDMILTRCQDGSFFAVWKYYKDNIDLELVDEINLQELREQMGDDIIDFKIQGKINTKLSINSQTTYDIVLLVTVLEEGIVVNCLKHKPLSEM